MKYLFDLNHPNNFYLLKSLMLLLQQNGSDIKVPTRDKNV